MREIIFNDKIALKRHKRSLSIQESFTRNSYSYESERVTIFKLKDIHIFKDILNASEWIHRRLDNADKKRSLSIMRGYSDKKGEGFWETRETGSIYILDKQRVLAVTFLHKVRLEVRKSL